MSTKGVFACGGRRRGGVCVGSNLLPRVFAQITRNQYITAQQEIKTKAEQMADQVPEAKTFMQITF